ncbi:S8 family serine peptidase [Micromonospora endolithica]|nr:S8 family serine peptidase [Micromonospora endolithica]
MRTITAAIAAGVMLGSGLVSGPAGAAPRGSQQWYFDAWDIEAVHKVSKGAGVTVAVIDSGVDASHPDLRGKVLPGHGIGADAAPDGQRDALPDKPRGTTMAGIIAGRGGDRLLGIAPAAKILPISVGKEAEPDEIAEAIRWAADHGATVINISLSAERTPTDAEEKAVRYALEHNAVVVAAVGATRGDFQGVEAPAAAQGVIAVSGLNRSGKFDEDSHEGREVVLSAPMDRIVGSSAGSGASVAAEGTDGSAALVSGTIALVRARFPKLTAMNVISRMIHTALGEDPKEQFGGGLVLASPRYGYGRVDPLRSLTRVTPTAGGENPLLRSHREATEYDRNGSGLNVNTSGFGILGILGGSVCLFAVLGALAVWLLTRRRNPTASGATRMPAAGSAPAGPPPGMPAGVAAGPPAGGWPGTPVPAPWPGTAQPPVGTPGQSPAGYPQAPAGYPHQAAQYPQPPTWSPPEGGGRS